MSWGALAQAIFFLAIALLATVITIFVFASSLLGRVVEVYAKEQEKLRTDKRRVIEEQLEIAQKLATKLKDQRGADDAEIDAAVKSLKDAKKQEHEFDKESNTLRQNYKVFTVHGGVAYPAYFFLAAMFLSALAWGLGASGDESFHVGGWEFYTAPFLYGLVPASLVLIGCGIARLHSSLKKIRDVAITSEEVALRRDIEAFKTAQKELELEAAPMLQLECIEPDSPPIRIEAGGTTKVGCDLKLLRGQIAEDISVYFYVPPGFDFPLMKASNKWVAGPKENFTGYLCMLKECSRLIKGLHQVVRFTIKAPTNVGVFEIKYIVNCRGLALLPGTIKVEVMPKSQAMQPKISKTKN